MSTGTLPETTVLHVGGLHYASEKQVLERVLGRRPGVFAVDANPVAQTASVTFDPQQTSIAALRSWVQDCGYHCAGRSVPGHVCDPLAELHADRHDHVAARRADEAHGHHRPQARMVDVRRGGRRTDARDDRALRVRPP